ncbi:MAG: DUF3305 domain-containing protein, partial [Gammaproteobacteria bacterium]|nr:DUF3305 domain-containing protein [Gammaproteobacteria bacterium]
MQDIPSDSFSVTAVMLKQASQHPWGSDIWSLSGIVPGMSPIALKQAETQGELYYWPDLLVQLHPLYCESYYHNLMSGHPMIYLVCHHETDIPQPLLITVDYDEAASYMETGDLVVNALLSDELCVWLEAYVLTHYMPEKPKKR